MGWRADEAQSLHQGAPLGVGPRHCQCRSAPMLVESRSDRAIPRMPACSRWPRHTARNMPAGIHNGSLLYPAMASARARVVSHPPSRRSRASFRGPLAGAGSSLQPSSCGRALLRHVPGPRGFSTLSCRGSARCRLPLVMRRRLDSSRASTARYSVHSRNPCFAPTFS